MVKMRDEQFSEGVMRSLNSTSEFLEKQETLHFLEQDVNIIESSFYGDYEDDANLKYTVQNTDGTVTNYTLSSSKDKSHIDTSKISYPSGNRTCRFHNDQELSEYGTCEQRTQRTVRIRRIQ